MMVRHQLQAQGWNVADTIIMDACLYPHRSLSRRGFRWLMAVMVALSTLASLPFYMLGAWPVVGFFGLDIVLLWVFFRLNYRDARLYENLVLTKDRLTFTRHDRRGFARQWQFNPRWVRVEKVEDDDFGLLELKLCERGREIGVGAFLSPEERASFTRAFIQALKQAGGRA
jgi:uncharacterized membrane protein